MVVGRLLTPQTMHDLNTSAASFRGDWRAVLEFLGGILLKDSVNEINLKRSADRWQVDVKGLKQVKKKTGGSNAGLYDLYW